jgi:hypothetical protein
MKRFWLGAAVFLAMASAASAETGSRQYSLGLGPTFPQDDYDAAFENGFHIDGAIHVPTSGRLQVRVDALYSRTGRRVGGALSIGGLTASLEYPFSSGSVQPYLMAGLGGYLSRFSVRSTSNLPDLGGGSSGELSLGGAAGGGLLFKLGGVNLFAESRFFHLATDMFDGGTQFVPLTLGVRFGGN